MNEINNLVADEPAAYRSGLADALFTSTQQRVLSLLFGQPGRSFYVTEIMRLAQSGRGAVQRELARLAESGLATVSMQGNQKHYQANQHSPLFTELFNIIRKTVGLVEPLKTALHPLTDRISRALIYGSVATGLDSAASDVDILIVADDLTLEEVYAALSGAETKMDRRISPTLYSTDEFKSRLETGNSFLSRIMNEPNILLFKSGPDQKLNVAI